MDGVIAVFWTDLDPGKVTDCPQTHHCGGGGNVYYKKDPDHLVRTMGAFVSHHIRACWTPQLILTHSVHAPHCAQTIEYAAVQSWSWNNQYNLPDPGQTFQAILWDGGDVLFQYLDMLVQSTPAPPTTRIVVGAHADATDADAAADVGPSHRYCKHCSTAWSTVSIGFEDQSGLRGQQIEYGDIPDDGSSYFVPANCHSSSGGGGGH